MMETNKTKFDFLTQKIIGCAFEVSNTLGYGFLEKVYERALIQELKFGGLNVKAQYPIIKEQLLVIFMLIF
ncbi:MAG: hypothetical protein Kow0049_09660 [Stanieria sp.]